MLQLITTLMKLWADWEMRKAARQAERNITGK